MQIGAPPDVFKPNGQDWGLTSFSPHALVAGGFAPFIATLRAGLRHAGGVRIDHAMGLHAAVAGAARRRRDEGAYLAYPLDDLLRLTGAGIASPPRDRDRRGSRHGAARLSRPRCGRAGIAGMDVLWFERERDRFKAPQRMARAMRSP